MSIMMREKQGGWGMEVICHGALCSWLKRLAYGRVNSFIERFATAHQKSLWSDIKLVMYLFQCTLRGVIHVLYKNAKAMETKAMGTWRLPEQWAADNIPKRLRNDCSTNDIPCDDMACDGLNYPGLVCLSECEHDSIGLVLHFGNGGKTSECFC
jgi:hypothetical protein